MINKSKKSDDIEKLTVFRFILIKQPPTVKPNGLVSIQK